MLANENIMPKVTGHVKIIDKITGEVLLDKNNAIHVENMSEALALSLADRVDGHLHEMWFGNGGSTENGVGAITYFPPNVTGQNANLYNPTYYKVIDDQSPLNTDPDNNKMVVTHTKGTNYSDITITCTLDYNEPPGQEAFDDATNMNGLYIFDEIGLKTFSSVPGGGRLVAHIIFNKIQKSLNRSLEIIYTLRIALC